MARETVEDWVRLGANEPWWGVLSAPEFLTENLTDQSKDRFYAQGVQEIDWVINLIRDFEPGFFPERALDFGCGLGRLSFAMSAFAGSVLGVDVSPGMLAEAEHQRVLRGFTNVAFDSSIPEDQRFDWVSTYIVLQHILPRTGYLIIADMLDRVNTGGWTSLQLTFAHDRRDINSFLRDAAAMRYDGEAATVLEFNETDVGEMSMYDYDMNRVLFLFAKRGFADLRLVHTDHGGVHGFWIVAKKR